jgi:hypothetical protein
MMVFAKGKWDENLNCYLPCGISTTWHTDGGPCKAPFSLGEYLTNDLNSRGFDAINGFINRDYENSIYVSTPLLSNAGDKYFYALHIYDPSFFIHNDKIGFSHVEPYVINDVMMGRCKIILIQDVEGMTGAKGTPQELEMLKIDRWCDEVRISPKNVYYISGNLMCAEVAKIQNVRCNVIPVSIFESWVDVFNFPDGITEYEPTDSRDLFLCYSRRPRFHRVLLLARMINEGIIERGIWSFSSMRNDPPIDRIMEIDESLIPIVKDLYARSPITIDRENESDSITRHISMSDYKRTFITVAGETLFDEGVLFVTEKTFKPIMAGVPFIVNGNRGTLSYLKGLGYMTFDRWIDESYDKEPDLLKRINIIMRELNRFSSMTRDELREIREEMKPVCLHNKMLIIERTHSQFMSNGKYYPKKPTSDILYDIWKRWNSNPRKLI